MKKQTYKELEKKLELKEQGFLMMIILFTILGFSLIVVLFYGIYKTNSLEKQNAELKEECGNDNSIETITTIKYFCIEEERGFWGKFEGFKKIEYEQEVNSEQEFNLMKERIDGYGNCEVVSG